MVQDTGRRAEAVRDLRTQIAELSGEDAQEVVFIDVSPRRQRVTLYRMDTGEPVPVPAYMVESILAKTQPDGGYAFTSDASKAPEYKLGTVKCFLHPDSPERPILQEIGLGGAFCQSAHLPNEFQKRIHAQHRHGKQWEAYQHYLSEQERKRYEERQDKQLEATLAMARAAGGQPAKAEAELESAAKGAESAPERPREAPSSGRVEGATVASKPILSVTEAAERYGLSVRRVQQLAAEGRLGGWKFGNSWAVEPDAVEEYLRQRRTRV